MPLLNRSTLFLLLVLQGKSGIEIGLVFILTSWEAQYCFVSRHALGSFDRVQRSGERYGIWGFHGDASTKFVLGLRGAAAQSDIVLCGLIVYRVFFYPSNKDETDSRSLAACW